MTGGLQIEGLTVRIPGGARPLVDNLSLAISPGEMFGLVGESGSGKSMTARSLLDLAPPEAEIDLRRLIVGDLEIGGADAAQRRALRGRRLALIFQDPLTALCPTRRIGDQVCDVLRLHGWRDARLRRAEAARLMAEFELADPERILRMYPGELSGGMRQRALIAMAFIGTPSVVIADEITSAIDASLRLKILALLKARAEATGAAVLFISHDLNLVRHVCARVAVMREGRIIETGATLEVLKRPRSAYTQLLIASAPELHPPRQPLLQSVGQGS